MYFYSHFMLIASLVTCRVIYGNLGQENENASHTIENDITDRSINLAAILARLDVPRLSRLLAVQYHHLEPHPSVFSLERGWRTTASETLLRRFLVYGNYLVYKSVVGDGSCMYHAIVESLRQGGFTVGRILQNLDHNGVTNRAVYKAMLHLEDPYRFLEMSELKRIAVIGYIGVDPYVDDSYNIWDCTPLLEKLHDARTILEASVGFNLDLARDVRFATLEQVDYFMAGLLDDNTRRDMLIVIFEDLMDRSKEVWGDSVDLYSIELALNFKILQLNRTTGCINCAYWPREFVPKSIAILDYNDGIHFDVAGIVNLFDIDILRSTRAIPLTSFPAHEMPMALALMVANDCKFQNNSQGTLQEYGAFFVD